MCFTKCRVLFLSSCTYTTCFDNCRTCTRICLAEHNILRQILCAGTGWGSYSVLKTIDKSKYDVIVVSPRNHFLFTPLLASTTVGTLEFRYSVQSSRITQSSDKNEKKMNKKFKYEHLEAIRLTGPLFNQYAALALDKVSTSTWHTPLALTWRNARSGVRTIWSRILSMTCRLTA